MSNRIEFLSRRNKGKQLISDYVSSLSEIVGHQTDIFLASPLDLEVSDRVYAKYSSNIRAINAGNYTNHCIKQVFETSEQVLLEMQNLAKYFPESENFYLVTKLTEFCGLVQISFELTTAYFDKIIAYDGDSLGLVSADSNKGILIDRYEESNKLSYDFIAYF